MPEEIIPKQYMRPGAKALILNSENKILVVTEKVVRKGYEWLTKEELLSRGEGYMINPDMIKAVARLQP